MFSNLRSIGNQLSSGIIILLLTMLIACQGGSNQAQPVAIDSYAVHNDLFGSVFRTDSSSWQKMRQNYQGFYPMLVEDILHIGPEADFETYLGIKDFVNDDFQQRIFSLCDSVFTEEKLEELEVEIAQAMGNWHAMRIDSVTPSIYYFQGGFNFGVISNDSLMGLGLEWWLGENTKEYGALPFPKYRVEKMKPEHLLPNAIKDWVTIKTGANPETNNLLGNMIHFGKKMHLTAQCLPDMSEHQLMNLTEEQINWFSSNEKDIWNTLAKQEVLYGTRPFDIQKWFVDGPNTGPLPNDSPPMAGIWIGWQMVEDYLTKTKNVSPKQLLQTPPEVILAKYRPGN